MNATLPSLRALLCRKFTPGIGNTFPKTARLLILALTLALWPSVAGATNYIFHVTAPPGIAGEYDLRCQLFADEHRKAGLGIAALLPRITITNREVTVTGDFGVALPHGGVYWLQIEARRFGSDADFAPLVESHKVYVRSPGQLTPVDHSTHSLLQANPLSDTLLYLLGMFCVLAYATERFNTPPTNKSTTTKIRYYAACSAYCGIGLAAYTLLIYSPDLITKGVAPDALPEWTKGLAPPLVVALALTIFLPKLPLLAGCDEWIRKKLQVIAAIPLEARRLSTELYRAPFAASEDRKAQLRKDLESKGFAANDIIFDNNGSLQSKVTRIAVLVAEIRDAQSEQRFNTFVATFGEEFRQLEFQYTSLLKQARRCFEFMREEPSEGTKLLSKVTLDLKEECSTLSDTLWVGLLHYVSRAILDGRFLRKSRVERARSLGFNLPAVVSQLTFNELVLIFCTILVGLLITFCFFEINAGKERPQEAITKSIMISIIYCLSVFFAIFPKKWWPFGQCPRPARLRNRPWLFYLTVGVISAISGLVVSALFRLALTTGDWDLVLKNFAEKYPYALVSFTTAFLISLCADNTPPPARANKRSLRGFEGLLVGGAGFGVAFLVHRLLTLTIPNPQAVPPVGALVGVFLVMGFFLGFCVPTWYREAARVDVPLEEAVPTAGYPPKPAAI
jgi:hypothetical protein